MLNSRFYFFEFDNYNYCFDGQTLNVFVVSKYLKDLLNSNKFSDVKKYYKDIYTNVLKKKVKAFHKKIDKTSVTFNFSNKCNLNCAYCFRNKEKNTKLSKESIRDIFNYVIDKNFYKTDAFSFSFCLTSESSLDIENLLYIDSLIAEREGYLFNEKSIYNKKLRKIYDCLPECIRIRHPLNNKIESILNSILKEEELWKYFSYGKNNYIDSFSSLDDLSIAKKVHVNRECLNFTFPFVRQKRKISYIGMWFMTNATNITDSYIKLIKSIGMSQITVSIDGPKEVNDFSRKYIDGRGTYNDIVLGIKRLQQNGISVKASVVIIPEYPILSKTIEFLKGLDIKEISFNIIRTNVQEKSFNLISINKLLDDYKLIFEKLFLELQTKKYDYIYLLKNSIFFYYVKALFYRYPRFNRCDWGEKIIIDSNGGFYHCDSTIGLKEDYIGSYLDKKIDIKKQKEIHNIDNDKNCSLCFAKYLCGGTCYAEQVRKNFYNIETECYYRKEFIKLSLIFFVKLSSAGLLEETIKFVEG